MTPIRARMGRPANARASFIAKRGMGCVLCGCELGSGETSMILCSGDGEPFAPTVSMARAGRGSPSPLSRWGMAGLPSSSAPFAGVQERVLPALRLKGHPRRLRARTLSVSSSLTLKLGRSQRRPRDAKRSRLRRRSSLLQCATSARSRHCR